MGGGWICTILLSVLFVNLVFSVEGKRLKNRCLGRDLSLDASACVNSLGTTIASFVSDDFVEHQSCFKLKLMLKTEKAETSLLYIYRYIMCIVLAMMTICIASLLAIDF